VSSILQERRAECSPLRPAAERSVRRQNERRLHITLSLDSGELAIDHCSVPVGRSGSRPEGRSPPTTANTPAPMPSLENLKRQAKQPVRWHREHNHSVGGRIRAAFPRYRDSTDLELLAMKFTLSMAQEIIAKESGFAGWAALKSGVSEMSSSESRRYESSRLVAVYPQLFVSDIRSACEFYTRVLGFKVSFVHGEPPFYGQVERDEIRLNLRYVCATVFDGEMRERERLLSAYIDASGVKDLYGEFKAAGADFQQGLKRQPWGVQDFVVRDPDGNLLLFGEYL
jgi:catechol 2,3-dioxygenase-like lactoylglutathione lyase family enzyme